MRRTKTREELEAEANSAVLLVMSHVHGNKRDRSIPLPDYDRIFAAIERREPFTVTHLCANLSITNIRSLLALDHTRYMTGRPRKEKPPEPPYSFPTSPSKSKD